MSDHLQLLQNRLIMWADNAQALGWLDANHTEQLQHLSTSTPADLFDTGNRPLVAALFGGTGVGKSTLLNRLAGHDIAQASAARPTSTNITAYVHSSVKVDHLPDEFPMQRMLTAIHQNDQYQAVMWLDMPDFDSVEASHRELVTTWLPHIDVLVYVVSPERYKDDQGWRLLLSHGSKHAWIFVINHWDKGDERQRDDFLQLLGKAGFDQPHLFCTDSSGSGSSDEFIELEQTIISIADAQLIQQLEKRGVIKRLETLAHQANAMRQHLGTDEQLTSCTEHWEKSWFTASNELVESTQWKAQLLASTIPESENSLLSLLPWRKPTQDQHAQPAKSEPITDDLFFSHIDGALDTFIQHAGVNGLPFAAIQRQLAPLKSQWQLTLPPMIDNAMAQSLAKPGERWHRVLHRVLGWLVTLMPLAALAWVAYRVITIFEASGTNPDSYLGSNFALHSGMLVGVAWFIPWFLRLRTIPSRQAAALRGIQHGIQACVEKIDLDCHQALDKVAGERESLNAQLLDVVSSPDQFDEAKLPATLQRMLTKATAS